MNKETKLCYFQILDGTGEEIIELSNALKDIEKKLSIDIKFIVSNERVNLHTAKQFLKDLFEEVKRGEAIQKAFLYGRLQCSL